MNRVFIEPRDGRHAIDGVVGQPRQVLVEPVRVRGEKRGVLKPRVHDEPCDAQGERGIGAWPWLQVQVGRVGRVGLLSTVSVG